MDTRTVMLAGSPVPMRLAACRADGLTWALTFADVSDPSRVTPALAELRSAAGSNLGGGAIEVLGPMRVAGMTPNDLSERVRIQGELPQGEAIVLEAGFFARGTRVFQVTLMGAHPAEEDMAMFFGSVKLPA